MSGILGGRANDAFSAAFADGIRVIATDVLADAIEQAMEDADVDGGGGRSGLLGAFGILFGFGLGVAVGAALGQSETGQRMVEERTLGEATEEEPSDPPAGGMASKLLLAGAIAGVAYLLSRSKSPTAAIGSATDRVRGVADRTSEQSEEVADRVEDLGEEAADRIEAGGEAFAEEVEEGAEAVEEGAEAAEEDIDADEDEEMEE